MVFLPATSRVRAMRKIIHKKFSYSRKVPDNWEYRNLPMHFNHVVYNWRPYMVDETDTLFCTPRGYMEICEAAEDLPPKYFYVAFVMSTDEAELKVYKLDAEKIKVENGCLLWQYWRYFDVLRFDYRKIFYEEIENYFKRLISDPPIDYETNKNVGIFLGIITNQYCSTLVEGSNQTPDILKNGGQCEETGEMKAFFESFKDAFFDNLSKIIQQNKYFHFNLVEPVPSIGCSVAEELMKRNLIFREVTDHLEENEKLLKKKKWPWPLDHLVYSSNHFMEYTLIIFDAIKSYLSTNKNGKLKAAGTVIYLFPDFYLHIFGTAKKKKRTTFSFENTIFMEKDNATLQLLRKLVEMDCWMPNVDKSMCTGLCAAAVRSHLFPERFNKIFDLCNFRYDKTHHPDFIFFPIQFEIHTGKLNLPQSYRLFIEKCRMNGHFFYQCLFGICEQEEFEIVEYSGEDQGLLKLRKEYDAAFDETRIYFLQRFLRGCLPVRKVFTEPKNGYQEKTLAVMFNLIDSMIRFPSLLTYYDLLKIYFPDDSKLEISKRLKERQTAEKDFMEYFQQSGADVTLEFKRQATRRPYIFYFCFIVSFKTATVQRESLKQRDVLQQFCKVLYETPKLRKFVEDDSKREVFRFRERLSLLLNSGSDYVPEMAKTMFKMPLSVLLSMYRWKTDINQFPKGTLTHIRLLGEGGQAVAYIVKSQQFPLPLVAKYFTDSTEDPAFEIECLIKMQFNPHVVQIFGYIVNKDKYIGILMEFCKGGSLDEVIKKGVVRGSRKYTEADVVRWAAQAASGLNYLHGKGILHRDVKPANMLLDKDHCTLKLSDLGISAILPEHQGHTSQKTNESYGTPGYVPFDEDAFYSAPWDVFGLGRSVWEMIVRVVPSDELVLKSMTTKKPDIISDDVWNFVFEIMHEDKTKRPSMVNCYDFFNERIELLD